MYNNVVHLNKVFSNNRTTTAVATTITLTNLFLRCLSSRFSSSSTKPRRPRCTKRCSYNNNNNSSIRKPWCSHPQSGAVMACSTNRNWPQHKPFLNSIISLIKLSPIRNSNSNSNSRQVYCFRESAISEMKIRLAQCIRLPRAWIPKAISNKIC